MSDRCLLSADELLGFYFAETQRWRGWLAANQKLLDLPIDIAQAKTVRDLVLHIVAVDLRYAERLLGEKVSDYEELPASTLAELFSTADRAREKLERFVGQANDAEWDQVLSFTTRSAGTLSSSKRKIFIHTLLHGMRHWAQLATYLRQQGHKQPWAHDFLLSDVIR
ncbi:MAG TPA: DinB family protein [Terriglobales bacterium]|nr:DinB family protein [Terriglobales bacterium]